MLVIVRLVFITGGLRKLNKEEFQNCFWSPDITKGIKSVQMRWVMIYVKHAREMRNACRMFGSIKERVHLGDPGLGGCSTSVNWWITDCCSSTNSKLTVCKIFNSGHQYHEST
jgi:hypothetical protein